MSKTSTSKTPTKPRSTGPSARPIDDGGKWIAPAIILGVLALVGSVIFLANRGGGAGGDVTASAGAKVAHVHGLGVDPGDGHLYAGTHYGLFRVPEQGEATRIAGRIQDFMGFTVAGPNHYLASGHPGAGQGGPNALGLIETTDGGRTWNTLSLAGEADFHALEFRHGRVYGLNAGTFMVSQDKKTWDTRGQVAMADFAVSPADPDLVVATTRDGLARSTDGGRTFAPIANAPSLFMVTWADDGTLIGIDAQGMVQATTDPTGAGGWERRGTLGGQPTALTATSGQQVFASTPEAILASTDGGRTFTTRYRD